MNCFEVLACHYVDRFISLPHWQYDFVLDVKQNVDDSSENVRRIRITHLLLIDPSLCSIYVKTSLLQLCLEVTLESKLSYLSLGQVMEISRVFELVNGELSYVVQMATNLNSLQPHLKALLKKIWCNYVLLKIGNTDQLPSYPVWPAPWCLLQHCIFCCLLVLD